MTNPHSVPEEIEKVWCSILETTDKILKVHLHFGFEGFDRHIQPSIQEILLGLSIVGGLLDRLYESGLLDYSELRLIFNSKQQILLVNEIAQALNNSDSEGYDSAIDRLRKQAPI